MSRLYQYIVKILLTLFHYLLAFNFSISNFTLLGSPLRCQSILFKNPLWVYKDTAPNN